MVRLATNEEKEENNVWEIQTPFEGVIRLWISEEDTVEDVKAFLGAWKGDEWELYPDEIRVECQGVGVVEGVPLSAVASSPLLVLEDTGGSEVWWAQAVPMRHLIREGGEEQEDGGEEPRTLLDLRFLSCDPRRIRSWLYGARDITEIWILGTHPAVVEILYAVAEDVRCLPHLRRIHLQHPSDAGFLLPPRSGGRMRRMGSGSEYVPNDVLSYLTQHLQLDAYRVEEEVEIWVDAGVLQGAEARGTHRLLVYP